MLVNAKQYEAHSDTANAIEQFAESLTFWPQHVEAALWYGLLLKRLGHISEAERVWRRGCTAAFELITEYPDWESRQILREQIPCFRVILYNLAILWSQLSRNTLADDALRLLGFSWKLHKQIWDYNLSLQSSSVGASDSSFPKVCVVDNVVPSALLSDLRARVFDILSPFWLAHNYFSDPVFFSYNYDLSKAPSNLVEQLIAMLRPVSTILPFHYVCSMISAWFAVGLRAISLSPERDPGRVVGSQSRPRWCSPG